MRGGEKFKKFEKDVKLDYEEKKEEEVGIVREKDK